MPSNIPLTRSDSGSTSRITRAAAWNQALWTAGYALSSGGFLLFFARELGATGTVIALLLVVPETAAVAGLLAPAAIRWRGGRKRVWIAGTLLARFVSLGIPLLAFPAWRPAGSSAFWLMVIYLALSQAVQGVAYVSYISWLADLVPGHRWGRFFAIRNVARLVVLLVVPVAGGLLRDHWNATLPTEAARMAYVVVFAAGAILMMFSLLPLIRFPDVEPTRHAAGKGTRQSFTREISSPRIRERLAVVWKNRSLRFLLIHNWWLAAANGVTQSAFFGFLAGPLGLGLTVYVVLTNTMRLVMIPVSWFAGIESDRRGNRRLLFWSVLVASSAMIFWLAASPEEWWWVIGAYVMWGAFAAANIAGRNLVLTLSPADDTATPLALFRQVGGFIAGLTGLAGGLWLDAMWNETARNELPGIGPYRLLFALSLVGRVSSVLWLLPIREPSPTNRDSERGEIR